MILLGKVLLNFERRTRRWLELVDQARLSADMQKRDRIVGYVAMEMQTGLGYVARSSYLAGMLGGKSAANLRIRPARLYSQHDALVIAARAAGRKRPSALPGRDEPSWNSSDHLSKATVSGKPANAPDLIAALGVFPDARKAVVAVRNFYAHRGEHTLQAIADIMFSEYAEVLTEHPSKGLLQPTPSLPYPILERWVQNYADVVRVMCGA